MESHLQAITVSMLKIGEPLPWDIYDSRGILLLRKGLVIANYHQLSTFPDREMFIDKLSDDDYSRKLALANVSVVQLLEEASHDLELLFQAILRASQPELTHDNILHTVKILEHATHINADICLSYLFFNKFNHDNYPLRHSIDTTLLTLLMAQFMEKSDNEIALIAAAALTMNVGMLTLQEQLLRRNNRLTTTEKNKINQHPEQSVSLLSKAGITDEQWLSYVRDHHEKINGSGYPRGLSGSDVSEGAQIISLADRYSACLAPRSYRPGMMATEAMRELFIQQADSIDVTIASGLCRVLGVYPPGVFVRLQNGEIGVVYRRGKTGTTPLVISFMAPRGGLMAYPVKRDTREKYFAVRGCVRLQQQDVPYTMQQLWGKQAE